MLNTKITLCVVWRERNWKAEGQMEDSRKFIKFVRLRTGTVTSR